MTSLDPDVDLGALAYATPPIEPQYQAAILVAVSILFAVLGFIVVIIRVAFRWWLRVSRIEASAWGWDDVFAGLGLATNDLFLQFQIPFEMSCVWAIYGAYYGLGSRDDVINGNIPLTVRAGAYIAYFGICHALCVPLIKASIAVALMRITNAKRYRFPLYFVLLASVVLCFAGWMSLVMRCKPFAALWNPQLGKCGDYSVVTTISYVVSIVTIITDCTCAIIPFFVLRHLQMSWRVKGLLMGVLGMGIFASVAAILRYPWLKYYDAPKDQLWYTSHIILWCVIESGLGLLAGSLPPLHKLRTILGRRNTTGVDQSGYSHSRDEHSSGAMRLESIPKGGRHGNTGYSTYVKGSEWDRLSDDASGKHIFQSHTVDITTEISHIDSNKSRLGL
ncbi:hypothetical protein FSARC_6275 [Fusarium sarcochroum]|uniref:Rhodopsin domain-containing protein n=1 Tax=Fusarium sarcochroum TaxID=1208366 RepID=A0A8H4TXY0_9HYPO|nr:hypothetical protein FSARC_6275 [Fusarium sarcochroum]